MISPLVMLKNRSCVMWAHYRPPSSEGLPMGLLPSVLRGKSGWHGQLASGVRHRGRRPVAGDDLIDLEQILRIVLTVRLRRTNEGGGHQLMIAGAVIALVGLQLDVVRQLEIPQRLRQLQRIDALFLIGD